MSETTRQLEDQLSEAGTEVHDWETLMESPGWHRLKSIIEDQMRTRSSTVMLTPMLQGNNPLAQEYLKGEYGGLALAIATPEAQLAQAKAKRTVIVEQLENEHETQTRVAATAANRRIPDPGEPEPSPFGE